MTPCARFYSSGFFVCAFFYACGSTRPADVAADWPHDVAEHAHCPVEARSPTLTKAEFIQPLRNFGKDSLAMLQQRVELQREVLMERKVAANQIVASQVGESMETYRESIIRPPGTRDVSAQTKGSASSLDRSKRSKRGAGKRVGKRTAMKNRKAFPRRKSGSRHNKHSANGADHASPTANLSQALSHHRPAELRTQMRESKDTTEDITSVSSFDISDNLTRFGTSKASSTPQSHDASEATQAHAESGGTSTQTTTTMNGLQLFANIFDAADDSIHAPQDAVCAMIVVIGVMMFVACCPHEFESQEKFHRLGGYPDEERKTSRKPRPTSGASATTAKVTSYNRPPALVAAPLTLSRAGPLCKGVPLPEGEICFSVDITMLEQASGFLDLCELNGRPLLRAAMHIDLNTGREAASISNREGEVLGAIFGADEGANPHVLEVHSKTGEKFGEFRSETGAFVFACGDVDVLHVRLVAASGLLTIDAAQTGERLGSASVNENTVRQDHLFVRVGPGSDAVLVLLSVFGVMLFGAPTADG